MKITDTIPFKIQTTLINELKKSPNKQKHSSCLVDQKGKIVSIASNNEFYHAEVNCLNKLSRTHAIKNSYHLLRGTLK